MPLFYEIFPKSLTQSLGFLQFFGLHALVLHQFYTWLQNNLCPTVTVLNMNMYGRMVIRIKPEAKSKYRQQCGLCSFFAAKLSIIIYTTKYLLSKSLDSGSNACPHEWQEYHPCLYDASFSCTGHTGGTRHERHREGRPLNPFVC